MAELADAQDLGSCGLKTMGVQVSLQAPFLTLKTKPKGKEMKIIEAMKELKVILKRINKNTEQIGEYAALPDNERLHFGTRDNQMKEIKKLIQANADLVQTYLHLKKRIELTNLKTVVDINGARYSISEMLVLKRVLAKMMTNTFNALNDNKARMRMSSHGSVRSSEKAPIVEKYYDESEKTAGQRAWDDLYHAIDSRLEVINATTELMDLQ